MTTTPSAVDDAALPCYAFVEDGRRCSELAMYVDVASGLPVCLSCAAAPYMRHGRLEPLYRLMPDGQLVPLATA